MIIFRVWVDLLVREQACSAICGDYTRNYLSPLTVWEVSPRPLSEISPSVYIVICIDVVDDNI